MSLRIEPLTIHRIHRCSRWPSVVNRSKLVPVPACRLLMRRLFRSSCHMPLLYRCLFLGSRPDRNAPRASVEAGAVVHCSIVHRGIIDHHGTVDISIVHYRRIYIHYSRIIPESPSFPSSPSKSGASISISIIHPAIETDMRTPVTGMPSIDTTCIAPITRGP